MFFLLRIYLHYNKDCKYRSYKCNKLKKNLSSENKKEEKRKCYFCTFQSNNLQCMTKVFRIKFSIEKLDFFPQYVIY